MRMMPHATQVPCALGRAVPVSGVTFILRPCPAFRRLQYGMRLQNNGIVKSEPKYLACKESPYVLSTFELFLVLLSLSWLLWWADFLLFFLRVASRRLRSALVYALGSPNTYVTKGQLCCPPSPRNASQRRCVMHVSDNLPERDHKLTFRA